MNEQQQPPRRSTDPVANAVQDPANDKLVGAKEILKEKLMRAVLQQAVQELGEPGAIARAVMSSYGSEAAVISTSAGILREMMLADIEKSASAAMADTTAVANEVYGRIDLEAREVVDASAKLRTMLKEEIRRVAISSIADPVSTARSLADDASVGAAQREAVSAQLRRMLLDKAKEQCLASLGDFEATAKEALRDLGESPGEVEGIADRLRAMLLDSVRKLAVDSIRDQQSVAEEARAEVPQAVIDPIVDRVHKLLVADVATESKSSLSDQEAAASEAKQQMGDDPAVVMNAANALGRMLLHDIARRAQDELSDIDSAVERAINRVDFESEQIVSAQDALKSQILSDVLNRAIAEINREVGSVATEVKAEIREGHRPSRPENRSDEEQTLESSDEERVETPTEPHRPTLQALDVEELRSAPRSDDRESEPSSDVEAPQPMPTSGTSLPKLPTPGDSWESVSDEATAEAAIDDSETDYDGDEPIDPDDERPSPTASVWKRLAQYKSTDRSAAAPESSTASGAAATRRRRKSWVVSEIDFGTSQSESPSATAEVSAEPESSSEMTLVPNGRFDDQPIPATGRAVYVYGIIAHEEHDTRGKLPEEGMDPSRPVRTIAYQSLEAVVSEVPAGEYMGENVKENLKDAAWLKKHVRSHATILEQIKSNSTIIPMRFCSVFASDQEVRDMLSRESSKFVASLDRVAGKQEWGVRIFRDVSLLRMRVADSERRVEDSLNVISKGVVTFVKEEMNRLDGIGDNEAVNLMSEHCARRSHIALLEAAADGVIKSRVGDDESDDIVLNAAYLVANGKEEKLRDEIERLASEYEELGFRFEISGPWPPYHFVNEPERP